MNKEIVINYVKDYAIKTYQDKNKVEFKNNKIGKLIEKLLLKLKLISYSYRETVEVKRKIINRDIVREQICEVARSLKLNHEEIDHFIIGYKQVELLEDEFVKCRYTENFKIYLDGITKVYGYDIVVNPYIDGIVPVLKER